jgi:hypothetical protein
MESEDQTRKEKIEKMKSFISEVKAEKDAKD